MELAVISWSGIKLSSRPREESHFPRQSKTKWYTEIKESSNESLSYQTGRMFSTHGNASCSKSLHEIKRWRRYAWNYFREDFFLLCWLIQCQRWSRSGWKDFKTSEVKKRWADYLPMPTTASSEVTLSENTFMLKIISIIIQQISLFHSNTLSFQAIWVKINFTVPGASWICNWRMKIRSIQYLGERWKLYNPLFILSHRHAWAAFQFLFLYFLLTPLPCMVDCLFIFFFSSAA